MYRLVLARMGDAQDTDRKKGSFMEESVQKGRVGFMLIVFSNAGTSK